MYSLLKAIQLRKDCKCQDLPKEINVTNREKSIPERLSLNKS